MRTSVTHPLRIDWLPVEGDEGRIGMTLCPGKKQPVSWTGGWDRQLDLDIESLKESGTTRIVSLVTDEDMELLQVTQLPDECSSKRHRMDAPPASGHDGANWQVAVAIEKSVHRTANKHSWR